MAEDDTAPAPLVKKTTPGSPRRRARYCAEPNCGKGPQSGSDRCARHRKQKGGRR